MLKLLFFVERSIQGCWAEFAERRKTVKTSESESVESECVGEDVYKNEKDAVAASLYLM